MVETIIDGGRYRGHGVTWRYVTAFVLAGGAALALGAHWYLVKQFEAMRVLQLQAAEVVLAVLEKEVRNNAEQTPSGLSQLVKKYSRDFPQVQQISFQTPDGKLYSALNDSRFRIPGPVEKLFTRFYSFPAEIIGLEIKTEETSLGKLSLTLNNSHRRYLVWLHWKDTLLLSMLALLFVFSAVLILLRRNLRVLKAAACCGELIVNGERSLRIAERGAGEFRRAGLTLNGLAALVDRQSERINDTASAFEEHKKQSATQVQCLEEQKQQAEKVLQSKSRYLKELGERLHAPLQNIMRLSEMLGRKDSRTQQRDFADMIHASALQLTHLVEDVADVSQLETGSLAVEKTVIDIRQLVEEARSHAMLYALSRQKIVVAEIDKEIPERVVSDPRRIRQIVLAILCSRIDADAGNQVCLRMRIVRSDVLAVSLEIEIGSESSDMTKDIIVAAHKVFAEKKFVSPCDAYCNAEITDALVYNAVKALEGEMVQRTGSHGDTVLVKLRLERPAQAQLEALQQSREQEDTGRKALKLLYAESRLIDRYVFELVFFHRGYVTVKPGNGEEVLERVGPERPDCILLDLHLPKISGYEVARKLRKRYSVDELPPVVILCGDTDETVLAQCAEVADLVQTKPVSPYTLIEQIEILVADRKQAGAGRNAERNRVRAGDDGRSVDPATDDVAVLSKTAAADDTDTVYTRIAASLRDIEIALKTEDMRQYNSVIEKLKANARKVGATALIERVTELESSDEQYIKSHPDEVVNRIAQAFLQTQA